MSKAIEYVHLVGNKHAKKQNVEHISYYDRVNDVNNDELKLLHDQYLAVLDKIEGKTAPKKYKGRVNDVRFCKELQSSIEQILTKMNGSAEAMV